ncbi:MAG TPA: phosphoribosylglycinamide formyltransferase [Gammaproteobacteria bacterium]|nr:phosphoribosylglycinamide formyltransferase [Gammaproteobacteria bacterium]
MSRDQRLRLVVLVSGEGTNLQALIDAESAEAARYSIVAVLSDRRDARGLERARRAGIPAQHLDPRSYAGRDAFDAALGDAIAAHEPGLIVLAGFMRILGADFVGRFAGRMLNIHPSLLPKLKGLHTHRRALENAETEHGATVHFVTAELDGGPTVIQYRTPVTDDDTEDTLSARVHAGEYIILPRAVGWFAEGRLRLQGASAVLDGKPLLEPVRVEGS